MTRFLILFAILFSVLTVKSQNTRGLYLPVEFQKAYQDGTRSKNGNPGRNYWQNRSDYDLKARIDPYKKTLEGQGDITYYNNSPDTLKNIVFFLYPDLYAKKSARDDEIDPELLTDGVKIEKVIVNDSLIDMENQRKFRRYGTRMIIALPEPLPPALSVKTHIEWNYNLPGEGRAPVYDSTSMFVAYWYPEVAVYDDIDGWNSMDFTGGVEFYHDYSNYKVEVQVPDSFLVWAVVPPDNRDDIYPAFIQKRLKDVNENKATNIVTINDIKNGIKVRSHTWKYTADDWPDFCFALSDHYLWDARLYKNKDTYFLNTVYPGYHNRFSVNLQAEYDAVDIYTNKMPAYPFPFKYFTAFNGLRGGGMEFPGMINDGYNDSTWYRTPVTALEANRGLTYHEMFHMYFPFYMGINETKYSWMDEGWASFSTYLIPQEYHPFALTRFGRLTVPPMMVPSNIYPRDFYSNAYTIGAYSYYSLQQLLGDQMFLKCLHAYIDRWHHKHPVPYDYFYTFSDVAGQDLNWFWKKWYFDWGYMDLGIKGFNGKVLEIQNLGGKPVAASVKLTYTDKSTEEREINPSVWKDEDVYEMEMPKKKDLQRAELIIPYNGDVVLDNNVWEKN